MQNKEFNCGCRDWLFIQGDRKERRPIDTYVVHECKKLLVCREPKTMSRTFVWKGDKSLLN